MARKAGKMRGDMRALEEQVTLPQSNPVRGGGATPSMGLSQFRGGGLLGQDGHGQRMVGAGTGGMTRMIGAGTGAGTKKGQMRLTARRAYEGGRHHEMEEAHRLGRALNLHLHNTHGAGYAKAFSHGCSGGGFFDFLDPNKNGVARAFDPNQNGVADLGRKIGNEFTNNDSILRQKVLNPTAGQFTDPNSVLRGQVLPGAAKVSTVLAPAIDAAGTAVGVPGAGTMLSQGLNGLQSINQGVKDVGYGRRRRGGMCRMCGMKNCGCGTGAGTGGGRERDDVAMMYGRGHMGSDSDSSSDYEGGQSFANPSNMSMTGAYDGQGTGGRRRRAPAGANDGRRKRAEIVKRVMAQKGLKMIEASKYVKEHNLY